MAMSFKLMLITVALLMCAGSATSAKHCPDCGTTQVPYPLSTGPDCGDQSYKIRCYAGALKFDTLNNTYSITSITPDTQRFVIQPSSFVGNTCVTEDLSTMGLHLNTSLPFKITRSNVIIYLNCTNTPLNSSLDCSAASLCHRYIDRSGEASACKDSRICCTLRAWGSTTSYMIRVQDSGCRAYRSFMNLDTDLPIIRWPQPGLEIQWVLPREPGCGTLSDCDLNSTCRSDPAEDGVCRCYCNLGLRWNPTVGLCAENVNHRMTLLAEVFRASQSKSGTAASYNPPYTPTACNGNDPSQFPSSNLFAAAGDEIWDNGAACGRRYVVRCISGAVPRTCITGKTIQVTIVDRAGRSASRPSRDGTTMVLSTSAFGAIASGSPASVNIQFQQV